jgi:hypothetical protein
LKNKQRKEVGLNNYTNSIYVILDYSSSSFFLVLLPLWEYWDMVPDCNVALSCKLCSMGASALPKNKDED